MNNLENNLENKKGYKPLIQVEEEDDENNSPDILNEQPQPEETEITVDTYINLLQGFVSKTGMTQAFTEFLNEQRETLIVQKKALRASQELEFTRNSNDGQTIKTKRTNSSQDILNAQKNNKQETEETSEEQIRKLRAYKTFLKIQQESKNQQNLGIDDYLNQFIDSSANWISSLLDKIPGGNSNIQSLNSSKVIKENEESKIEMVSQKDKEERMTLMKSGSILQIVQTPRYDYDESKEFVLGQQKIEIIGTQPNENDEFIQKIQKIDEDLTEQLGDLNLRAIQMKKDKSRRWFPIYPDSNFRSIWDLFVILFICYQACIIPYRFCFKARAYGTIKFYEFLIDCFFIADLCLNFVTGYYKKGNVIMKRGPIIRHYLRTWFIIDLLATIPWSWFVKERNVDYWPDDGFDEITADDGKIFASIAQVTYSLHEFTIADFDLAQILRLLKLFRFIRIIKVTQLFKLRKLIYRYEQFFFNDTVTIIIDFFKIFLFVFYFVHWIACIFFLVHDVQKSYGHHDTWVQLLNKEDTRSAIDMYIASASWSFTTIASVGYGDVYPISNAEKVFGLVAMMTSVGIFSFIVGAMGSLFDKNDQIVNELQDKIISINQFLVLKKIPKDFRKKVKRYFRYIIENKRQYKLEENEVMELLNENLQIELIVHLNGKMLHDSAFFKFYNLSFLSELTFVLKRETFTLEESIFDEDTVGEKLLYITKGNAILIHKKTATFIADSSLDSFIGVFSFFTGLQRRTSARSKNFTETLTLQTSDFYEIAQKHPQQLEMFKMIQNQLQSQPSDLSILEIKCYVCQKVGHIAPDCKEFGRIKGNLRQAWLKRMKMNTIEKERGPSMKKVKRDFSLGEYYVDESDNDRGSIVEMFSQLEKRYKQDKKKEEEESKSPKKSEINQLEMKELRDTGTTPKRLTHLKAPPNFKTIEKQRNSSLYPKDQIDEQSFEDSVRESMRKSIDSQLALVNKLTNLNLIKSSDQFKPRSQSDRQADPFDLFLKGNNLAKSTALQKQRTNISQQRNRQIVENISEKGDEDEDDIVVRLQSEESPQNEKRESQRLIPLYDPGRFKGQFSTLLEDEEDIQHKQKAQKVHQIISTAKRTKAKHKRQESQVEQLDADLIESLLPKDDQQRYK